MNTILSYCAHNPKLQCLSSIQMYFFRLLLHCKKTVLQSDPFLYLCVENGRTGKYCTTHTFPLTCDFSKHWRTFKFCSWPCSSKPVVVVTGFLKSRQRHKMKKKIFWLLLAPQLCVCMFSEEEKATCMDAKPRVGFMARSLSSCHRKFPSSPATLPSHTLQRQALLPQRGLLTGVSPSSLMNVPLGYTCLQPRDPCVGIRFFHDQCALKTS